MVWRNVITVNVRVITCGSQQLLTWCHDVITSTLTGHDVMLCYRDRAAAFEEKGNVNMACKR